jgi:hypothetical protein
MLSNRPLMSNSEPNRISSTGKEGQRHQGVRFKLPITTDPGQIQCAVDTGYIELEKALANAYMFLVKQVNDASLIHKTPALIG